MRKRILFIEDDPSLLVLYRRAFTRQGYEVLLASNPEDAARVFRDELPDAVVVDVKLAGEKSGLEVLAELLAIRRVPMVINTAFASFRSSFLSWSADAYVLKSSDLTELEHELARLLQKEEEPAAPAPAPAPAPKQLALGPARA